jgi:ferrous iron transport protein A
MAKTVSEMKLGETGVIAHFDDEQIAIKLMEMGFLPGTAIRFNFAAPFGDPVCVTVSDYDLSLRIEEASTITIIN